MKSNAKYIICAILDYFFTYGTPTLIVLISFFEPTQSLGYKISFGGIIIFIFLLFYAKSSFEKKYQNEHNSLLQQLAEATSEDVKHALSKELDKHKMTNDIYQKITMLLPFIVLFIVTFLGATSLENLQGTIGFVLIGLGIGSIFNVVKKPLKEKARLEKIIKK